MDNSVQQQMFSQMQQMQQMQQQMQQQQMMSYQAFQQQMLQSQYSQAGALQQSVNTMQQLPNTAASFIGNQIAGMQSGFGIPAGTGSFLNQHLVAPIGSATMATSGLASSYLNATLSSKTNLMSIEQRQELANALANGTGGLVSGVAGGAGKVVGSVGGFLGSAAMYKAVGLGWGMGLGALGWAGGKLATSQTLSELTGGAIGGANENIFHPVRHIQEELKENRELTSLLSNNSYTFLAPGAKRNWYTGNLTTRDSQSWSNNIRKWDTKFGIEDKDVQSILKSTMDNGLIGNVRDFDDFEEKFGKQVKYVRNASKILSKSYKDVIDMMADFKRAGVGIENFDMKAAELKTFAAMFGKTIDHVKDFMLSVSSDMTKGTSVSTGNVMTQVGISGVNIKNAYDNAKRNGDTSFTNFVDNNGGIENTTAGMYKVLNGVFSSVGSIGGQVLTAASSYNAQTGKFSIDNDLMSGLLSKARSGQLTTNDIGRIASNRINTWGPTTALAFQNQFQDMLLGSTYQQQQNALNLFIQSGRNTPGLSGLSDTNLLTTLGGIDYNSADFLQKALAQFSQTGANDAARLAMSPLMQISYASRENYLASKKRGWFWGSTGFLDDMATKFAVSPVQSLQVKLQDVMNGMAGLPSENLQNYQLSGRTYDFSNAGIAQTAITLDAKARAATSNMNTIMGSMYMMPSASPTYSANARGYMSNASAARGFSSPFPNTVSNERAGVTSKDYMRALRAGAGWDVSTYDSIEKVAAIPASSMSGISSTAMGRYNSLGLDDMFNEAASSTGVNASILRAIGYIESGFNPNAGSSAGAKGIMQLMPDKLTDIQWNDPYQNIMKGSRHFKGLVERYKGNVMLAAGAYNGGGGAMDRYLRSAFGFDSSASKEQLMGVDINKLLPYITADETRNYMTKFNDALGKMGFTTDSVNNTATKQLSIMEYSANADMVTAGSGYSNVAKSGLYRMLKDSQGWTTKRTTEHISRDSIDLKAVNSYAKQLGDEATALFESGDKATAAAIYRSSGFLKSMATMKPSELTDSMLQDEINVLNSTLGGFKGSAGVKKSIQGTISVLKDHMSTTNTYWDTTLNSEMIKNASNAGLMFAKDLSMQTGMSDVVRNTISGLGSSVFSKVSGYSGKNLGDISIGELASLGKDAAELKRSVGTPTTKTGTVLSADVATAYNTVETITKAKVSDILKDSLQGQVASVKGPVNFDAYNASISKTNELKKNFVDASMKGDAKGATNYAKQMSESADLVRAQQNALENNAFSSLKKNFENKSLNHALNYTSTKVNRLHVKGDQDSDTLKALESQQQAISFAMDIQAGNNKIFEAYSKDDALRMVGALAPKAGYNLGFTTAQINAMKQNVGSIYDSRTAMDTMFGTPDRSVGSKGVATIASTKKANLISLMSGGEITDDANTFMSRIERGVLTSSGRMKLRDITRYGNAQEAAMAQAMLDQADAAGGGEIKTSTYYDKDTKTTRVASSVRNAVNVASKVDPGSDSTGGYNVGVLGYKDDASYKDMVKTAGTAMKIVKHSRDAVASNDSKYGAMVNKAFKGDTDLLDKFMNATSSGDIDTVKALITGNKDLFGSSYKAVSGYYLGADSKQNTYAFDRAELARAKALESAAGGSISIAKLQKDAMWDTAKITDNAASILLGLTEGMPVTLKNKKGAKMRSTERAYKDLQGLIDDADSMSVAEFQTGAKTGIKRIMKGIGADTGMSESQVAKFAGDKMKKTIDDRLKGVMEAISQTNDENSKKKLEQVAKDLNAVKDNLQKAGGDTSKMSDALTNAVLKMGEANQKLADEQGKSVDSADKVTKDYIAATEKYYDMVENRISDLQSRMRYIGLK